MPDSMERDEPKSGTGSPDGPDASMTDGQGASKGRTSTPPVADGPQVFFPVLVALMIGKAWIMRGFALGAWNPLGALLEAAFVMVVMGAIDVIPPGRRNWLDLATYVLLSVLMFAMTVYLRFYAQLFDPSMITMAGQLGSVTDVIAQLMKPKYIAFFIDVPLLAWWAYELGRQARRQRQLGAALDETAQSGSRRVAMPVHGRSLPTAITAAFAAVVLIAQVHSAMAVPGYVDGVAVAKARGLSVAQAAVFLPNLSKDLEDGSDIDVVTPGPPQVASTATSSIVATAALASGGQIEAKVERVRRALEGSRIATFSPGAFRGKNVIIVQVEALNTMVMQKTIDGEEITPNLNKLIGQSWYFPNTYSETGIGNTADAEFIVNSSLYAPRGQAAPVAYPQFQIPALPRLMAAQGYDTFTLHPNNIQFWNRKELYAALGFGRYYDVNFFQYADKIGMGSSDETLFRKGMEVLGAEDTSGTPFYSLFITLSAHTPFSAIPQWRRPVTMAPEYQGSLVGNYISAESYSDLAIGQFIKRLEKSKIWDKSIVIFYGDHTAMFDNQLDGTNAKAAKALLGRDYGPADRQRIPLIIHLPGQTNAVLNTDTVGQVDIMPTVADLIGIDLTQVPHMGRSVFVESNALVPLNSYLPGGSFLNDEVLFMPGLGFDDGSAVTIANSSSIKPTNREADDFKRMLFLTKLSDQWVRSLPKRSDARGLEKAFIPDDEARKAAALLSGAKLRETP